MPATTLGKSHNHCSYSDTLGSIVRSPVAILDAIYTFHTRSRDRARYARLNDHLLEDIGITREQAERQADRPFRKE